jgi:hypothetical protein
LEKNNRNPHHFLFFLTLFLRPPRAFFYDNDRVKSCCRCALKARCYSVVVFDTFPLSFRRREMEFTTYLLRTHALLKICLSVQFKITVKP